MMQIVNRQLKRTLCGLTVIVLLIGCTCAFADATFLSLHEDGEYFIYSIDLNDHATLLKYGVLDTGNTPETISIPAVLDNYPLRSIGDDAFNCSYTPNGIAPYDEETAKQIILPEGLISLEPLAFNGASGFEKITLPGSLTDIKGNFDYYIEAVFSVSKDNPRYTSVDGFLIDQQEDALLYAAPSSSDFPLPEVKKFLSFSLWQYQPEKIVFPETTEFIAEYTCYDNTETSEIIIPGNVITIDDNAFYAMAADKILLQDGIKHLGAYAFYNTEIRELHIPGSVEWIGFDFCDDWVDLLGQPAADCVWETEEEYLIRTDEFE